MNSPSETSLPTTGASAHLMGADLAAADPSDTDLAAADPADIDLADADIEAAGCVVVRPGESGDSVPAAGSVEVLLVHRPASATRPADWSWPKGKLEAKEPPAVAAVRETAEETGIRVYLSQPLPTRHYRVIDGAGATRSKRVRYWLARPGPGGTEATPDPTEIDDTAWVTPARAREVLTYPDDVALLDAALPGDELPPVTWPMIVLRHARAVKRTEWRASDAERPLLDRGHVQSRDLAPLLACFDLRRVVSSSWARCVQTVLPVAELTDLPVLEEESLTEAAHALDPQAAADVVTGLLAAGGGAVVCSHGPVLPLLQGVLAAHTDDDVVQAELLAKLGKGEFVVAHVTGRGSGSRIVAAQRHRA
ncbi:MAG: NUDIX hydrolase [Janthinobacterium lividum]